MISAARPKIGDYPFTTLSPNLGVVQLSAGRTFVVADIPGIIEGAHEGKGLGLQFLRHIERTRLLAFLIPVDSMDWQSEYDQLRAEIAAYSPGARRQAALRGVYQDGLTRRRSTTSYRRAGGLCHSRHQRSLGAVGSIHCLPPGGPSFSP